VIAKGNEGNQFELRKRHGFWSLNFRRRLKKEGRFEVEIRAVNDDAEQLEEVDESLDFNVHIHADP
jgi:hypothetical protein